MGLTCAGIDGHITGRESLCGQTVVGHEQQGQLTLRARDGWRHWAPTVPVIQSTSGWEMLPLLAPLGCHPPGQMCDPQIESEIENRDQIQTLWTMWKQCDDKDFFLVFLGMKLFKNPKRKFLPVIQDRTKTMCKVIYDRVSLYNRFVPSIKPKCFEVTIGPASIHGPMAAELLKSISLVAAFLLPPLQ